MKQITTRNQGIIFNSINQITCGIYNTQLNIICMDPYKKLIKHFNQTVPLNEEEENLLRQYFVLKDFSKNDIILFKGNVSRHVRFIVEGCLKAYTASDDGKEHIVHFGVEGWWINDLYSYFTQTPATLFIAALEKGMLLQTDKTTLDNLFDQSQSIERFFRIKFQSAYVAFQDRTMNSLSKTAEERYVEFCEKYREIEQRVPQYALASYLGITPEFLSLLRKKQTGKRN